VCLERWLCRPQSGVCLSGCWQHDQPMAPLVCNIFVAAQMSSPRSLSTDLVELAFAEMSSNVDYKATAQQLFLHSRRIDFRACIKKNPVYIFTARVSCRKLCPLHKLQGSFNFNDPLYLNSGRRVNKVLKLAGKKVKGKECTIRSYHNSCFFEL